MQAHNVDNRHEEAVISADDIQLDDANPDNLQVGSDIQYGEPPQYGVIKWIGHLLRETGLHAGLEMVWAMDRLN